MCTVNRDATDLRESRGFLVTRHGQIVDRVLSHTTKEHVMSHNALKNRTEMLEWSLKSFDYYSNIH